jgi:hypothetical protein
MAPQQVEEEWTSRERRDRTDRELSTAQQGAGHRVAHHEEGGTSQRRGGHEQAVVRTEQQPQQVGNDERGQLPRPPHLP